MNTKRELRKTNATDARRRVVKCHFVLPVVFAVVVREHTKKQNDTHPQNMKTIRILTATALLATSSFLGVAQAEPKAKDIVAVAAGAGSFNTLVAAV